MEQLRASPVVSSPKHEKKRENQCDVAHDIEKVIGGWRLAPKQCLDCEGYDIQCPDYSYERNKK